MFAGGNNWWQHVCWCLAYAMAQNCEAEMTDNDEDRSHWQTYPPWVVFDAQTKTEWVTPETLRYFVAYTDARGWFICDRFRDEVVEGTQAESRMKAIRRFYEIRGRKIPHGWEAPAAYEGASYNGP